MAGAHHQVQCRAPGGELLAGRVYPQLPGIDSSGRVAAGNYGAIRQPLDPVHALNVLALTPPEVSSLWGLEDSGSGLGGGIVWDGHDSFCAVPWRYWLLPMLPTASRCHPTRKPGYHLLAKCQILGLNSRRVNVHANIVSSSVLIPVPFPFCS